MDLVLQQARQLLRPLSTRVANLAARALVSLVKDSTKLQTLQLRILDGEVREGAERFQEYGFTSVPLDGAEAVVLSVGGRRDHLLVVAVDDRRHRKKDLAAGEVALYTDEGAAVHLKRGRIVVTDEEIRLGSDSATNFVALADLVLAELNAIRTAHNAHVHVETGASTLVPTVQLGAAASVAATKVKAE
jgi:phage baseplate assembly protein V